MQTVVLCASAFQQLLHSLPASTTAATAALLSGAVTTRAGLLKSGLNTPTNAYSTTSSAAQSSWLPAPVARWLGKARRGSSNYPASPLQPGTVTPRRHVPPHISRPHYATAVQSSRTTTAPGVSKQPEVHTDEASRAAMRAVGQLAAQALQLAGDMVTPGTTTDDIDAAVHDFLVAHGAYPSPLLYHGFPKSVCTSVNEVVCHGIPDTRPLREGDIINIDVTAYLAGYHGDTNATFYVGCVSEAARELVESTRDCLDAAISICGPGVPFRAIGDIIHSTADAAGMYVVRDFYGHGIGRQFHAAPAVPHYRNMKPGVMEPWQTFTIEPILALGTCRHRSWSLDSSGWTAVTVDSSLAAQFEHTVLITDSTAEVLTLPPPRDASVFGSGG